MHIHIKTSDQIEIMREGAKILREVQILLQNQIREGVKLSELDTTAEKYIRSQKAIPSFKGYQGFPATLCTMVNSEVVHGVPSERKLKNGDILSVDCGVLYKGFHTDAAFSVIVGGDHQHRERSQFSDCVKRALYAGCEAAKPGGTTGDIGHAIEKTIQKGGYSICREYTGHGLGTELHEDPHVYNFGKKGQGNRLVAGMTMAIEPIVALGSPQVKILKDGWTVVTVDGRDACQWEHCGVVTENGFEIFV
jgi:methionyl aminopeptidase